MRRIATCLFLGAFVLVITGCKSNDAGGLFGGLFGHSKPATTTVADSYQVPTDTAIYEPQGYPAYNQPTPQPAATEAAYATPDVVADHSVSMESSAPRYHTVAKRDTLYAIARTYYGDQRRWKDIYEANRNEIGDPNRIRIGQRLLIP